MQSLRRSIVLVLALSAIYGGFFFGRAQGARRHAGSALRDAKLPFEATSLTASAEGADPGVPPSDVYDSVLDHVQHEFVEGGEICDNARLNAAGLSRMLAALDDPGARYLDPVSASAYQDAQEGAFQGIGAALTVMRTRRQDVEYRYLTIVDALPGSPAQRAGLMTGDRITAIDGHWVIAYSSKTDFDLPEREAGPEPNPGAQPHDGAASRGISLPRALERLTCGTGDHLSLAVNRAGHELKVDLDTASTAVEPVEYRLLGDGIGYLRVREMCARAAAALDKAFPAGVDPLRGVVVDLRGCPGGARAPSGANGLTCAERLLTLLTRGGTAGYLERHPGQRSAERIESSGSRGTRRIVVLIDNGTANLAELVASGLRDCAHARLIGSRTFGDDSLPIYAALKSGAGVQFTSAHLFTAGGADLSRGVEPDIAVPPSSDAGTDPALARAIGALQG